MPASPGQILHQRYRVVKLLGQGGFGAVYRAWDLQLGRPCALKENLDLSAEAQRQFEREASLLFNLQHPNLPKVYDLFVEPPAGQYLVMDFIEGEDLQTTLDQAAAGLTAPAQPPGLPEAQILPWISQVCAAVEYLHARNPAIIHRDIKPANIRITPEHKAVLVDFGIAKVYDPRLKTTLAARAITPGYSPPEQYGHGSTDARSDVYALGATVYSLLTGQRPPPAVDILSGNAAPPPPARSLNPAVSARASAAVARAMKLRWDERFASAAAFEQALLHGEGLRLPRRPAMLWAGILVLLVAVLWAGSSFYRSNQVSRPASLALPTTPPAATLPPTDTAPPPTASPSLPFAPTPTYGLPVGIGTALPQPPDAIAPANASRLAELGRWGRGVYKRVAWSPDGRLLAVGSTAGIYLYAASDLQEVRFIPTEGGVGDVQFSPDGRLLAASTTDDDSPGVGMWRSVDGAYQGTLAVDPADEVLNLSFSAPGDQLVIATRGSYYVFALPAENLLHKVALEAFPKAYSSQSDRMAFASNGAFLVYNHNFADEAVPILLWNSADGRLATHLTMETCCIGGVVFSPDGQLLAALNRDAALVWQISDGALLRKMDLGKTSPTQVAWTPDGKMLGIGTRDGTVEFWEVEFGRLVQTLPGDSSAILEISFSADGNRLATVGENGSLRVQQAGDGQETALREDTLGRLVGAVFSADGRHLVTSEQSDLVRSWQFPEGRVVRKSQPLSGDILALAALPDELIMLAGRSEIGLWHPYHGSQAQARRLEDTCSAGLVSMISPGHSLLASGSWDGRVCVWRTSDGGLVTQLELGFFNIRGIAVSPDESTIAFSGSNSGRLSLLDAEQGKIILEWETASGAVGPVAFSPSGQVIASSAPSFGKVQFWNQSDGSALVEVSGLSYIYSLTYSPSGSLLAAGTGRGLALIDVSSGAILSQGKPGSECFAFSPDERYLVCSDWRGLVYIYGVQP